MAKRWNVVTPRARKDSEKVFWHRVGTAFEGAKGINIILDSLPLPDKDGRCALSLFEAEETRPVRDGRPSQRQSAREEMDDDIPFDR